MELQIGTQFRKLRRLRNLTQEEVAAHLGISFQAISKWERGEGYPDITLLPALAHYFDTTVDDLLGMHEAARREMYDRINRRWESNNAHGLHGGNIALMKDALRDWPNDALLMVQLSTSLEKLDGTAQERRERLRESAAVQEQILRYGRDAAVCSATQFNICFTYQKLGEREKAIAQAGRLPNLYKARENALVNFLEGEERLNIARDALEPLGWAVRLHLGAMAEETHDDEYARQADVICAMLAQAGRI